ncbi:MAG: hypothetical protein J5506_03435 [Prevotella sp.]|nr:hypothetical protein [Prevotella sp.]
MDAQERSHIFKPRSYAACIRNGFKLIANHPVTILRATWPYIVLMAIFAWFYYHSVFSTIISLFSQQASSSNVVAIVLSLILFVAVELVLLARVMMLLKHFRDNGTLPHINAFARMPETFITALRQLPFIVIVLIVSAIISFAYVKLIPLAIAQPTTTMFITIILGVTVANVLFLVFVMPLLQTFYSYVMDGGDFVKTLRETYPKGLRHIGKIFAVNLLTWALLAVAVSVLSLPLIVLMFASGMSVMGTLVLGDASGMPGYMPWLMGITAIVCISLSVFACLAIYTTNFYVYGSIEAIESERKQFKNL